MLLYWWQEHIPNITVIEHYGITRIEVFLQASQLHWIGHVIPHDSRITKWTFYGQLQKGSPSHGGQLKCYKDNLKNIPNQCCIPSSDIESLAKDRTTWQTMCSDAVSHSKERHVESLKEKHAQCKEGLPVNSDFLCVTCGAGLFVHTRTDHL